MGCGPVGGHCLSGQAPLLSCPDHEVNVLPDPGAHPCAARASVTTTLALVPRPLRSSSSSYPSVTTSKCHLALMLHNPKGKLHQWVRLHEEAAGTRQKQPCQHPWEHHFHSITREKWICLLQGSLNIASDAERSLGSHKQSESLECLQEN